MGGDGPLDRYLWPALASIAGSITSLSFRPFMKMPKSQIVMALFVGFVFAFFVGPLAVSLWFGGGAMDRQQVGGFYYLLATGSNALIPLAVKKISQFFNVKGDGQ
jgi:hypothetical protein